MDKVGLLACSKSPKLIYHYSQYSISFESIEKDPKLNSEILFDFRRYWINIPIDNYITLNMTLNAKFDYFTQLFQMKEPINTIQKMDELSFQRNEFIINMYNTFIHGYIRKLQSELVIPPIITTIIKHNLEIGAATFYCDAFRNPISNT